MKYKTNLVPIENSRNSYSRRSMQRQIETIKLDEKEAPMMKEVIK